MSAIEHLAQLKTDPWADYWNTPQELGPAMARLGFTPPGQALPAAKKKKRA